MAECKDVEGRVSRTGTGIEVEDGMWEIWSWKLKGRGLKVIKWKLKPRGRYGRFDVERLTRKNRPERLEAKVEKQRSKDCGLKEG